MYTLISFSEAGYSLVHHSEDFSELESIQRNPEQLDLDGLLLNERMFDLGGVCGSVTMGDDYEEQDDYFGRTNEPELFILDQEFVDYLNRCEGRDSEDMELCEMLINQFPEPSMLKSVLYGGIAA